MTGAAGLAIAAAAQVQDAVNATCIQPLVTTGLDQAICPGTAAEFLHGLIYAVLAGVAFFSGLACLFWAAHLRSLHAIRNQHSGEGTAGHRAQQ